MKQLILLLFLTSGFITWSQVPNYVPTDSLIGWWPFNGNANDESGNGNDGTNNGATLTTDRFGNTDAAYSFTGRDQGGDTKIIIAHDQVMNSQSRTIAVWLNKQNPTVPATTDFTTGQTLTDCEYVFVKSPFSATTCGSKVRSFELQINSGSNGNNSQLTEPFVFMPAGSNQSQSTMYRLECNSIFSSLWYHVVYIQDGQSASLYVNGNLIETDNYAELFFQNTADVLLGQNWCEDPGSTAETTRDFTGVIDDFGMWSRALTECEIQDLYNAELNSIQIGAITSSVDCSAGVGNAEVNITQPNSTEYAYSIDNLPFQNSSMFSDITPGNHMVIVKDIYDCETDTITVNTNCGIPVFDCTNCLSNGEGLYQVYGSNGNIGSIDVVNNNYSALPNSPANENLNAIGYSTEDSLAYGIIWGTKRLFVLDANGSYYDLGNVTGLPVPPGSSAYTAGEFDNNGFLHIKRSNMNNTIYKIDVKTKSLVSTYNLSSSLYIGDLVFNPIDNKFYTIGVNQTENLYSFTPDIGTLTTIGNTNMSGAAFGSLFSDATGRIWAVNNVDGNIHLINTQNASTTVVAQVATTTAGDGFSCRNSIININVIEETDTQSACDEYTWLDGTTYTENNNAATYTETNIYLCDSIVYSLDLTVLNSSFSSDIQEACEEYTWIDGNTYTESNNTATFLTTNAVGCDSVITLNLTINNLTTLSAGANQTVCEGTDVTLTAIGAAVYEWDNGIQNGVPFPALLGSNTYSVEGTDANGCEDEQSVTITGTPYPELIFEVTDPACQGEASGNAVVVAINGTSPYTFVWNNGTLQAENNGISAGAYEVTVADNNGCETQGSVVVIDPAEPCFYIPGGLSPNGDGVNDTWTIGGLENYPDAAVNVFDRWGQAVYTGNSTSDSWDGTTSGKECPTADYYYILELGDGQKFNGVVTLKR